MNPTVREAIILAAGRGTRLGVLGRERPKGFLCLGDRPIVEESVDRLRDAGIERIVIVTGHRASAYESLAAASGGRVETVTNPAYAHSGSLQSLCVGAGATTGDVLLLESDLVYEKRALETLLAGPRDAILLSGPSGAGDEVFVETDARGALVGMSKAREALGQIAGELVGICRLSRDTLDRLTAVGGAEAAAGRDMEYEVDGLVAVSAHKPIGCVVVEDLLWAEIDDLDHLRRARDRIYPRIRRADGGD